MRGTQKMGLVASAVAVVALTACGNKGRAADNDLARDLQLAPHSGTNQMVVSAIEGGPTAAPKRAAPKPVAKPVTHAAPLRAEPEQQVPAPRANVAQREPAPHAPAPAPQPAVDPRNVPPLPPFPDQKGAARDRGTAAEGQIFQHMPWIRP